VDPLKIFERGDIIFKCGSTKIFERGDNISEVCRISSKIK
jgi:hypothetical protein